MDFKNLEEFSNFIKDIQMILGFVYLPGGGLIYLSKKDT